MSPRSHLKIFTQAVASLTFEFFQKESPRNQGSFLKDDSEGYKAASSSGFALIASGDFLGKNISLRALVIVVMIVMMGFDIIMMHISTLMMRLGMTEDIRFSRVMLTMLVSRLRNIVMHHMIV